MGARNFLVVFEKESNAAIRVLHFIEVEEVGAAGVGGWVASIEIAHSMCVRVFVAVAVVGCKRCSLGFCKRSRCRHVRRSHLCLRGR